MRLRLTTDSVRIPWLVVIEVGVGLLRLFESAQRYMSPGYTSAKELMSIHSWGWLFLGSGLLLLFSWLTGHDRTTKVVAFLTSWTWFFWAMLSIQSAESTQASSYSGALFYLSFFSIHLVVAFRGS